MLNTARRTVRREVSCIGVRNCPLVEIALFARDMLATGMTLALQDFVDPALVDAKSEGDLVLVFAVPAVEPDLYGIIKGETVIRMFHVRIPMVLGTSIGLTGSPTQVSLGR